MPELPEKPHLSPTALPARDAAQVLSKAGGRLVTEAMLRADIDAGRIIARKGLHHPFMSPCTLCDYAHVCDA